MEGGCGKSAKDQCDPAVNFACAESMYLASANSWSAWPESARECGCPKNSLPEIASLG